MNEVRVKLMMLFGLLIMLLIMGADIINLSFTGSNYNKGFREAIERANRAGIIVVTAAGNNSANLRFRSSLSSLFSRK